MPAVLRAVGNQGISSLIWAAHQGALEQLRRLVLSANRLSSMAGLSSAFAGGGLPALRELVLSSNRIRVDGVADLANAALADGRAAIGKLDRLLLAQNAIGTRSRDGGEHPFPVGSMQHSEDALAALANACEAVRTLDISSNGLDDTDLEALTAAFASGRALAGAHGARLDVSLNTYTLAAHQRLAAACDAHGGVRVLPPPQ